MGGYAVADPSRAGVYDVVLGPPGFGPDPAKPKAFSDGNYVVVALGPVVDGKYDWAVVSDFKQASLYILTRDVSRFETAYETDVLAQVAKLGFTSIVNKPLKTNQKGCTYDAQTQQTVVV